MKEAQIKLFGTKIVPPVIGVDLAAQSSLDIIVADACYSRCSGESTEEEEEERLTERCEMHASELNRSSITEAEEPQNNNKAPESSDCDETSKGRDSTNGEKKLLMKPDKILRCPRCDSTDTKFCYYNNYNINQPRHFCKCCQRYWTAGGTMRNVPVGAGRRKTKNSSTANRRHVAPSEALLNSTTTEAAKPSGAILSFGPDSPPLCDSTAAHADERARNGKNGDSSGAALPVFQNLNGFPSPVPCIPSLPLMLPLKLLNSSSYPVPALYAVPFFPAPYWNCAAPIVPSDQNAATGSKPISSSSSSLGKHSRDGEALLEAEVERRGSVVAVPKTLRIDDPEEAAKSTIWKTLGIEYDSVSREGLFRALQPKGVKVKVPFASPAMQANPAALFRSVAFQETA